MPHSITSGLRTELTSGSVAPVVFFEVDTPSGNAYFWTGFGQIPWNGITWTGLGNIIGFSAVTETTKVQAAGASVTMSGVSSANVSLALNSLRRFYPMKEWLGAINSSFAVVADPFCFFDGVVDTCNIIDSGPTATIEVIGEGRLLTMRAARTRHYTDQDQRIERPADGGFKFVDFLQNHDFPWGAAGAAQAAAATPPRAGPGLLGYLRGAAGQ